MLEINKIIFVVCSVNHHDLEVWFWAAEKCQLVFSSFTLLACQHASFTCEIKVTYQGETHKGAHERNSVADLRIKNGSFAHFAQVFFFSFFVLLCLFSFCFLLFLFLLLLLFLHFATVLEFGGVVKICMTR